MVELLLTKDAAKYCGMTQAYLLNQAKSGKIAYIQPSTKRIMFAKVDLNAWIAGWVKFPVVPATP